jgi:single-strand DNA-binding protein
MLFGNLGADPELRTTSGGQAILKLRLATTESYLDKNRARQERTEWHSVTVWGKRGESLAKILQKGSRVFIEGSLRTSSYDDREGNKRYKTEVVASNVILGGGGTRNASTEPAGAAPAAGGGWYDDADYGAKPGQDDDFPF